jgi:DNA gyrase/topoisomerase IV subunit A
MTVHTPPPEGGRIVDEPMSEALSRRYLAYALSTITNRALPDVRDGFKPVHRRIMYAMHHRSGIRWSTVRAISGISTAITPRPCATPSAS